MNKWVLNIVLLLAPFVMVVAVNEITRPAVKEAACKIGENLAMNSALEMTTKCSWACHNRTDYCKGNHVKIAKEYLSYTDFVYFGVIDLLHKSGSYKLANIILLVIIIPLIMYLLLIKSIILQKKIKELKSEK